MSTYDGKLEQARMAIAEEWTRTIMRPILATGMVSNLVTLAGLDDGHDMEWILDVVQSEKPCEKCDGEGKIDCPKCDGTGHDDDPDYDDVVACEGCKGSSTIECDADGCDDGQIQIGEIYEYWIVSERAERRLRDAGETMIDPSDIGLGQAIWCRRCTGQAISGDSVIMNCAEAFAIDCPWALADVDADHVAYWTAQRTYTIRGSDYARSWPGYRDTVIVASSEDHAWELVRYDLDVERSTVTITRGEKR